MLQPSNQSCQANACLDEYVDRSGNIYNKIGLVKSSTKIAESTAGGITAMMTIALLGLCYSPTAFMSTLFSSVFFGRDPNTDDRTTAKDIWILVIATLLFTILTILLWVWLNRYGELCFPKFPRLYWYAGGRRRPFIMEYLNKGHMQPIFALFIQVVRS